MKDALGNDLVIGQTYGYSQKDQGHVHIVTGVLEKVSKTRATLVNVKERRGVYGEIKTPFTEETRKRSVNAVMLFPIPEYSLGDKVTTEYYEHGEVFEVIGICKNELLLRGDWSGGTHNVDQTSWYPKEKCKRK
jgi:hypothetical protein